MKVAPFFQLEVGDLTPSQPLTEDAVRLFLNKPPGVGLNINGLLGFPNLNAYLLLLLVLNWYIRSDWLILEL